MRLTWGELRLFLANSVHEASLPGNPKEDIHVSSTTPLAKQIEPEVFDIIMKSYAPVGGNAKVTRPADISNEYSDWIVSDVDGDKDVDVFVGGNPRHGGMKLGASATDGTPDAKAHMMSLKKKLFTNGWWAEVSGAPAHIALNKLGVKHVSDEGKVRQLLDGKKITWYGEHPEGKFPGTYGWYSRDIGGHQHVKIIVGDV